jgi:hypothetical protein
MHFPPQSTCVALLHPQVPAWQVPPWGSLQVAASSGWQVPSEARHFLQAPQVLPSHRSLHDCEGASHTVAPVQFGMHLPPQFCWPPGQPQLPPLHTPP